MKLLPRTPRGRPSMPWAFAAAVLFGNTYGQTTTGPNGNPEYSGTPVLSNPNGIPTMVYNCAKMPSICNNVHGNSAHAQLRNYALNTVLDPSDNTDKGWKGTLAHAAYLELNIDKGGLAEGPGGRINQRRKQSCGTNWKRDNPCPKSDQPVVVPEGSTVSSGFVGQRLRPNIPQAAAGSYLIADMMGAPRGMAWTCDEFPPASTVEGGFRADLNRGANTYCAPQANAEGNCGFTTKGDQDFQSYAHGLAKVHCSQNPSDVGIFTIHFKTEFQNDVNSWVSRVDYYTPGNPPGSHGALYGVPQRRAPHKLDVGTNSTATLNSRRFYSNGTILEMRRAVDASHGHPHLRKRENIEIDPFDEIGPELGEISVRVVATSYEEDSHLDRVRRQDHANGGLCEIHEDPPDLDTEVPIPPGSVQEYTRASTKTSVQGGKKLRILTVGDSITVGFLSNQNGGDGNGYRRRLVDNLKNKVVFAGTESMGTMQDNYYAAWSGKTIKYISDHIGDSLKQNPNLVLLMAGTNDMHPDPKVSTEGSDPIAAVQRLGNLMDKIFAANPETTLLVGLIMPTCTENKILLTEQFQALIPYEVQKRRISGRKIMAVDMGAFPISLMRDCVHPTNDGYSVMGDYWYDFITQIPDGWVTDAQGDDPKRDDDDSRNGGPDPDIPAPNWGKNPVDTITSKGDVRDAAQRAEEGGRASCKTIPHWEWTGKVAQGLSRSGDFKYKKAWKDMGEVAEGIGRDIKYVRLVDMNGDGKADYVWLDPNTGMTICWLNNLPKPWSKAGTNDSIIASGAGRAASVYLQDMNGDGKADYMVVDPDNGSVRIWWNYGPDDNWDNGWKFVAGGEIATGVPHANWGTLRFPDINGDGRGDYVTMGVGGSLRLWLNIGHAGAQDPIFYDQHGIATGASQDLERIVFADLDGDGRDDYLIWDDDAGFTGFLNKPTHTEGVPIYINQGPAKTLADGVHKPFDTIRLADMNGDGKDDYVILGDRGSLHFWENQGEVDTSMTIDGLRFADINGDGIDDYVWLHPKSGAPVTYVNKGPNSDDSLGWYWQPLNGGNPIASGVTVAENVQFGDIDGDGYDDYLVLHPETGELTVWLNKGPAPETKEGWLWKGVGSIASGLGPAKNIRFADIDGDGSDDYIFLKPNGGTIIYRNTYGGEYHWQAMPDADASGIGRAPEEISFYDINGDGKADYVWVSPLDGRSVVWLNNYPNKPTWLEQPEIAGGVGVSGRNVRFAYLQASGRASYLAIDPDTGAIAAWLNGCKDRGPPPETNMHPCVSMKARLYYHPFTGDSLSVYIYEDGKQVCKGGQHKYLASDETVWTADCGDNIIFKGSWEEGIRGEGWYYENKEGNIVRHLKASMDDRWNEDCGGTETRKWKCYFQTFHSRDKCGMELEPIDKPPP